MMTAATGYSIGAMTAGVLSLMLALLHYWTGPLAPDPSLSTPVDAEQVMNLSTTVLGGLAIIMGAIGMLCGAPFQLAGTGLALGAGAIIFQIATSFALLIFVVLLIYALLYRFGDYLTLGR